MSASFANILRLNTGSTTVTTGAVVQIAASTPIPTSKLVISNGTTSILEITTGVSGSEVGLVAVVGSGIITLELGAVLPAGTRIGVQAIDANASSGYIVVSLLP